MTNLFADDAMIYVSGDNVPEVQQQLQNCLNNIGKWYRENRLKINSDKSKVMLVGSKTQPKSLNGDEFILNYGDMPLELVENAKNILVCLSLILTFHAIPMCNASAKYVFSSVSIKTITSYLPQGTSIPSL